MKLHPAIHPVSFPDGIRPLAERMQAYDKTFPLYVHSSPSQGLFNGIACRDIRNLAREFPDLRIIVGHAACTMEYAIELGLTLKDRGNVFF